MFVDVYPVEPPAAPVSEPRFVPHVHLGTLARYLRLLGFDTEYDNHSGDEDLQARMAAEAGTLLTRDWSHWARTADAWPAMHAKSMQNGR